MEKQILKFGFVALSLLVVGVNAYAQISCNKTLRNEGTRQIISGAKRITATNNLPDGVIPASNEDENLAASKHRTREPLSNDDFTPLPFFIDDSRVFGCPRLLNLS